MLSRLYLLQSAGPGAQRMQFVSNCVRWFYSTHGCGYPGAGIIGVTIGLIAKYENDYTKHLQDYRLLKDILGIEDCGRYGNGYAARHGCYPGRYQGSGYPIEIGV